MKSTVAPVSRARQRGADELTGKRMRGLSVIMAFYGVGYVLANRVPGLEVAQKAAMVIGHSAAYNSDQFWIYCATYCLSVTFQPVIGIGRP